MGLDIIFGFTDLSYCRHKSLAALQADTLARHGLKFEERETKYEEGDPQSRAYAFRETGEYCREHSLPFPMLCAITCSQYEMISPVAFEKPLQLFAGKRPKHYGLSFPRRKGNFDKMMQEMIAEYAAEGTTVMIFSPGWGYYMETPYKQAYLISAPQVIKESTRLFDTEIPGWKDMSEGEFEAVVGKRDHLHTIRFVAACCSRSVKRHASIWYG